LPFCRCHWFHFTGWGGPQLPPARPGLGYVYLPALLGIVLTSVLFAPVGAWLARRLPANAANALRQIFAIVLVVLGIYKLTPH